ncbi:hypothetical protein CCP2SC5_540018 [Azospirillaceae bacterium]
MKERILRVVLGREAFEFSIQELPLESVILFFKRFSKIGFRRVLTLFVVL